MAKATGIASQARGKVGNVVYYLSKNRAGRLEQTVKGYQPVVANPQSYAQALARVPIGPVQRVCSALLPLIQRGFEGTAYGEPSKSEFLSLNLRNFRGPFMTKGAVMVPPGPMIISKGSLATVAVDNIDCAVDTGYVTFKLNYSGHTSNSTKGQITMRLLARNTQLVVGEQLTFVIVILVNGEYQYRYESLFLDPKDTSSPRGVLGWLENKGELIRFAAENAPNEASIIAAACIRSQAFGESSFKRSTAILECCSDAELYNDDAAVRAAVASYRTGEDPEDWEDDPTPEYQQLAYVCLVNITEDMVLPEDWSRVKGKKCLGYVTKGGEMGIFYLYSRTDNANCLLDSDGSFLRYTYNTEIHHVRYLASYQPAREWSAIYGTMTT